MFARPAAILFLAVLTGCSTVEPVVALPAVDAEAQRQEDTYQLAYGLERLRQQDGRVAAISHRLNVANADLCHDKAYLSGLGLHHAMQYTPDSRALAIGQFHMTGRPSVATVAPGGPADQAGIRQDDTLVSIDGTAFNDVGDRIKGNGKAVYDETQRARVQLDQALADGSGVLVVERDGQRRTVTLKPVVGCAYEAQLLPSDDFQASADGRRVFITTAFVRYAVLDDQLAVVLSHELAHNVMRHRTRIAEGPTGAILGNAGTMMSGLMTVEKEADYVSLYLMARAGYDYAAAPNFWRNYAADFGRSRYAMGTHPGSLARAISLTATAEEIAAKTAAGQPITPTPARLKTAEGG